MLDSNSQILFPTTTQDIYYPSDCESSKFLQVSSFCKEELIRSIDDQLINLGFININGKYLIDGVLTKDRIRSLHQQQRKLIINDQKEFIEKYGKKFKENFAFGDEIDPNNIQPELIEVLPDSEESKLFRFATLMWSVPVSQGFGRRIRFIVKDKQNSKLIGLFAIGDPVFNLSARDRWIGWEFADRKDRLAHIMDAYVVGAVPPYSYLIGGKLIASLITCKEVSQVYERKYLGLQSIINHNLNDKKLVLVTTTSSMGKSSLYNRLKIEGGATFLKIGETRGYGHFHLTGQIFEQMRCFLEKINHPYAIGNRFGDGPNWKIRVARAALEKLGYNSDDVLNHGIAREVYAIPLARNWKEVLLGMESDANIDLLTASEICEFCKNRWIIPRSYRDNRYKTYTPEKITEELCM
jgi:hypothetical protein